MDTMHLDKKSLRKFGITMAVACLVIAVLIFVKHRHIMIPVILVSAGFFATGLLTPFLLKPLYCLWMRLAFVLSWVNTRIILLLVFFLIFTPIGLVLKLLRKDLLDRKIDKDKDSYWQRRQKKQFSRIDYERLF